MSADAAAARLDELAVRYRLDARQRGQLACLLTALEEDPRAPTSVREPGAAVDAHLADSLVALELEVVRRAHTVADLGAGAGLPGVVLAIAMPGCAVALVESRSRRCDFLSQLLAELGLEHARVVCARAEQWREGIDAHELVVARALGGQAVVLEYAAPLLRPGGTLVDWRGRSAPRERPETQAAAAELGLRLVEVRRVVPFEGARDRNLHVYLKVSSTPARFPRRAGMARKRPLGAAPGQARASR